LPLTGRILSDQNEGNSQQSSSEAEKQEEEPKPVTFSWGIVMVRTKKLLNFLDNLAKFRLFSDLGWVYIAIMIGAGGFMIWLMLDETYLVLNSSLAFRCLIGAAPPLQCQQHSLPVNPQPSLTSYLLLPGINPYIPVVYGIIGIVVAVVVHEGTHGVIARRLKLPVKSTGLLFFLFVPVGAFVEIDEKLIQKIKARDSSRIMAGGPGSNVIVAVIALFLLVLLLGGLVPLYNGVLVEQVFSPSPANTLHSQGHLQAGDFIQAVNGTQIISDQTLSNFMSHTRPGETLLLTIDHQGKLNTYNITLAANPSNSSIGFIGVSVANENLSAIKNNYANAYRTNPFLYLIVPGIVSQAETIVPFSATLHNYYSSPVLGNAWYPIGLTVFWIFFININLAFFNAIPLYPLDGGQAIMNWFSHFGRKWVEVRARLLTTICSLVMLILILTFLFLPRILALIPY
jgi:membrane-associated protease RseP (regulator of RpoE activity)